MTDLIPTVELIDAVLPQTQCTKCGYPGCHPYAEAIAQGDAINKCPPGGQAGIRKLATLLNRPEIPLDTQHGEEPTVPLVAFIREAECIGCTKCIQACPVDAILGAAKLMHTVITDICTGCDLCVAPCPVDCIDMVPAPYKIPPPDANADAIAQQRSDLSRQRFHRRNQRLAQQAEEKSARRTRRTLATDNQLDTPDTNRTHRINQDVAAALAAVRNMSDTQSPEARLAQLTRTLASAQERLTRADAKVQDAERTASNQLPMLQARREDLRFKRDEAQQKRDALQRQLQFADAAEKITALRSRKDDRLRIADGMAVIERKITALQNGLHGQTTEQRAAMEWEITRLQQKYATAQQALNDLPADDNQPT